MSTSFWSNLTSGGSSGDSKDLKELQTLLKDLSNIRKETNTNNYDINNNNNSTTSKSMPGILKKLKQLIYSDSNNSDSKRKEITTVLIEIDLFPYLIENLIECDFEMRKDITAVFNFLLSDESNLEFVGYINNHGFYQSFMNVFKRSSKEDSPDVVLLCGSMYRCMLRHVSLYEALVKIPEETIWPLLDYFVHLPNFEISSDTFETVRGILHPAVASSSIQHKTIASKFIEEHYDVLIPKYNLMMQSNSNYITKRLSLNLLGEILLDRSNFNAMMKYIASRDHLKIIMLLLRDPSGNIQFEAFHVFKIFVANPRKPDEIKKILFDNRVKLVAYLDNFHKEKEDQDRQFREEKALLITTLNNLENPEI